MRIVRLSQRIEADVWYVRPTVHNALDKVYPAIVAIGKIDFHAGSMAIYDAELTYIAPCSKYEAGLSTRIPPEKKMHVFTGIPEFDESGRLKGVAITDYKEITVPGISPTMVMAAVAAMAIAGAGMALTRKKVPARA